MKPKLSFVWFLVALALAAILVVQWRAAQKQELLLETLQVQVEQLVQKEKAAQARAAELLKENGKLRGEVIAAELEANRAQQAAAAATAAAQTPASARSAQPPEKSANPVSMMAEMLKDPDMRQAMEHQQRMAMEMMYTPLIKKLNLSPEEAEQFKGMLFTNQMANVSQAAALAEDGKNPAEMGEEMALTQQSREENLKQFLGDERYQQYQNYNQTIGERVMLDQFGKQMDLQADQTEQLLSIFQEEKQNAQINQPIAPGFDPVRDGARMMGDPDMMDRYLAQQELVNQQVMQRARQVLSPEQAEKFGPFLNNQINMQRMGMKMAQKMMGQEAPAPPEPPTRVPANP